MKLPGMGVFRAGARTRTGLRAELYKKGFDAIILCCGIGYRFFCEAGGRAFGAGRKRRFG
ncbi:hypothetical protein TRIP_B350185 [uncultured Desulfatiglans sp.]|nr:hypothetical protein TRIP_B350185 [uncultured Desulfatiglans sp.]